MANVAVNDVAHDILNKMYPALVGELQGTFDDMTTFEEAAFVKDLVVQAAEYLIESRDYNDIQTKKNDAKPKQNKARGGGK